MGLGEGRDWADRLGSGDGERKTLLTRQIAFEPLPASVSPLLVVEVSSLGNHYVVILAENAANEQTQECVCLRCGHMLEKVNVVGF
jgi:hypothetical protein